MKLFLARHGQTDWNVERRAQGRADVPLNDTGRQQAAALRQQLQNLKFNAVYASPLQRAAETAQIVADGHYDVICDERLVERSCGDFEGQVILSWADIPGSETHNDLTLTELPNHIEPVRHLLDRTQSFLKELKSSYPDDATILIVTHKGAVKAFDWLLSRHGEGDTFGNVRLDNAEVREYEL